jgi:hypothetical protein
LFFLANLQTKKKMFKHNKVTPSGGVSKTSNDQNSRISNSKQSRGFTTTEYPSRLENNNVERTCEMVSSPQNGNSISASHSPAHGSHDDDGDLEGQAPLQETPFSPSSEKNIASTVSFSAKVMHFLSSKMNAVAPLMVGIPGTSMREEELKEYHQLAILAAGGEISSEELQQMEEKFGLSHDELEAPTHELGNMNEEVAVVHTPDDDHHENRTDINQTV